MNTKDIKGVIAKSHMQAVLGIIVTLGFFGILGGTLLGYMSLSDNPSLMILLGTVATGFGTIFNYYFGSSLDKNQKNTDKQP